MITIIIGRAIQFSLALVMMRVATTLLTPEEMGRVSLVLTSYAFFALFFINPVSMFINRRLHAWQESGVAKQYLIRYMYYVLLVALNAAIVLIFIHMSGVVNFGISLGWLIFLVCAAIIFYTINQTSIPLLNLLGDSKTFVWLSLATIAVSFVCAMLLVQIFYPLAQYWIFGLLLGQAIIGLYGTQIFISRIHSVKIGLPSPVINKKHLYALYGFAWPVVLAAGSSWVQGQGYRYILGEQLGLVQLGLFVAGYGISAGMIAGFESILTTYFQPRLYRDVNMDHPLKQAQAWQRYAAAVIPPQLLTVAIIAMLAPELTWIFLGKEFQSASDYVIWGAFAEATRVLIGVYTLIGHVFMQTRWLIAPNLLGAILSIALTALLLPVYGATGAGIGLVSSGIVVVIMMHLLLSKHVGGGTPFRPILRVCISAAILWVITLALRYLLNPSTWVEIIGVPGLIGLLYLGMQYFFIRQHLKEKRES